MTRRYILAWFPMVLIAIANGGLRESVYRSFAGELTAHQLSTLSFVILSLLYVLAIGRKWRIASARQALTIGGTWLAMSIVFEFGFGHWIMGNSWSRLLHDYDLTAGRVWIVALLAIALGPYFSHRVNRRSLLRDKGNR